MNRSDTHSQARCDLAPGSALGTQGGNLVSVYIAPGPAQALAPRPRYRQARAHPLADQLPLELGDAGENAEVRLSELAEEGRAPATLNRYRSLLSLTYRLAIRNGKVRDNPARQVQRRKENNARVRFLDADEETALREKVRAFMPGRAPEFDLALHTGMRRNEQYRLRWENVNLDVGIVTVMDSKNGERRYIPLNSEARRALETLSAQRDGSGYVCPGTEGERKRDWQRWFEQAAKKAGIANLHWHDLRHTFASRLAMAGVPLRTIAELLGHKTLAMTMRYAHLAPAHLQDAVECLVGPKPTDTRTDTGALAQARLQSAHIQ